MSLEEFKREILRSWGFAKNARDRDIDRLFGEVLDAMFEDATQPDGLVDFASAEIRAGVAAKALGGGGILDGAINSEVKRLTDESLSEPVSRAAGEAQALLRYLYQRSNGLPATELGLSVDDAIIRYDRIARQIESAALVGGSAARVRLTALLQESGNLAAEMLRPVIRQSFLTGTVSNTNAKRVLTPLYVVASEQRREIRDALTESLEFVLENLSDIKIGIREVHSALPMLLEAEFDAAALAVLRSTNVRFDQVPRETQVALGDLAAECKIWMGANAIVSPFSNNLQQGRDSVKSMEDEVVRLIAGKMCDSSLGTC